MLNKKILSIFKAIIAESHDMVMKNVDHNDLTGRLNYAAIFAQTKREYEELLDHIKKNGKVSDPQPTGDYFQLTNQLETKFGFISTVRVRKPDPNVQQKGYVDFETVDYELFKDKYLIKQFFSKILNVNDIELIKLFDPKFNVHAYFPENF